MVPYILALIITAAMFLTGADCLQCYQCFINPLPGQFYNTTPLCVHFDYSDKFIVDCPDSTMCMKKELTLDFLDGVKVSAVHRNCAPQKYDSLDMKNGQWTPKSEIKEPYAEGCQIVNDKEKVKGPSTRYCYCRNDLCNSSPNTNHEGYTDIMGVIVVFNLMKYINSLR